MFRDDRAAREKRVLDKLQKTLAPAATMHDTFARASCRRACTLYSRASYFSCVCPEQINGDVATATLKDDDEGHEAATRACTNDRSISIRPGGYQ